MRDSINVEDIDGAAGGDKYKKYTTRNHIRSDDIEGAQVKIYHKIYYDKEKFMGAKEPPKKTICQLR